MITKFATNAAAKPRSRVRKFARTAEQTDTAAQEQTGDPVAQQPVVEESAATSGSIAAKSNRTRRTKKAAVEPSITEGSQGSATAASNDMNQEDADQSPEPGTIQTQTTSGASGDGATDPSGDEATPGLSSTEASATEPPPAQPKVDKPQTKTALILDLLQRDRGASLEELVAATGWLPHTTRAALTGLKKKGHVVSSDKVDDVRTYRVVAGGAAA